MDNASQGESIKRRLLPWNQKHCGGPNIHGTKFCSIKPDETGILKCYCNPPPDLNYELCYNFIIQVRNANLHLCDKDVGNSWSEFAAQFYVLNNLSKFDPVQGTALKKTFNSLIKKARLYLIGLPEENFTPYDKVISDIIGAIDDMSRDKQIRIYFDGDQMTNSSVS